MRAVQRFCGERRTVRPMPRQAKKPSIAQDILMLGDLYLTLGWLAFQRLRHGPLWPWEAELGESPASVVTLAQPEEKAEARPAKHV